MPRATKSRSTSARVGPTPNHPKKASTKTSGSTTKEKTNRHSEEAPKKPEAVSLPESYLLLVRLVETFEPCVTRLISVPTTYTFAKLHHVLQIAFGWASCHAHSFEVSKLLEEGEQANWVTGCGETLLILCIHDDLKDAYPDPDKVKQEAHYTLADIYEGPEYAGKVEVSYEYDHGDSWRHSIAFLGKADPSFRKLMQIPNDMQVICLAGEGHPCAEDSGGPGPWEELKETLKKKRGDADGMKSWYKNVCANGEKKAFDPYKWDILDVNDALAKVRG